MVCLLVCLQSVLEPYNVRKEYYAFLLRTSGSRLAVKAATPPAFLADLAHVYHSACDMYCTNYTIALSHNSILII